MSQKAERALKVFRPWLFLCENERNTCCLLPTLSSMESPSALQILAWATIESTQRDRSARKRRVCHPIWMDLGGLLMQIRGCLPRGSLHSSYIQAIHPKENSSLVFFKSIGSSRLIGSLSQHSNFGILGGKFSAGM